MNTQGEAKVDRFSKGIDFRGVTKLLKRTARNQRKRWKTSTNVDFRCGSLLSLRCVACMSHPTAPQHHPANETQYQTQHTYQQKTSQQRRQAHPKLTRPVSFSNSTSLYRYAANTIIQPSPPTSQ
eukprot:2959453-Amphidinium_carterae.1